MINPKPSIKKNTNFDPLNDEDRIVRCKKVRSAIGSVEAEGGVVSKRTKQVLLDYANGKINFKQLDEYRRSGRI